VEKIQGSFESDNNGYLTWRLMWYIIALTRQQWLRERSWMLRFTYIACLV